MIDRRVFADVLIEGLDDWVPIDQLIWAAREGVKGGSWKGFFAELLNSLLENDLIQIGELAAEGFSPWRGRPAKLSSWYSMTLSASPGNPSWAVAPGSPIRKQAMKSHSR
ncbi:hypothetical protein [Streptomyces sp. NBC_01538]|uniref:hypothetical protein n=1 Tax=Streptomyces sp. NBC_01538 TaxID=2903897 RepID=UPI00386A550B